MCCFSGPVKSVSNTKIFARAGRAGRQFVAYQMRLDAPQELAMILPLPTSPKPLENDVRFFEEFKEYPQFFEDLERGFPQEIAAAPPGNSNSRNPLKVVDVGNYEASFVPNLEKFERLDERFQLPSNTWKELPKYSDFSFAVFRMKPGLQSVHPMVFDFPRRYPRRLFFPTVHIHDGKVHPLADFDHVLYLQASPDGKHNLMKWEESKQPAGAFVNVGKTMISSKTESVVDLETHVYRYEIHGEQKNVDVYM
ncbi:MAG TPA: hypothetical protein VM165_25630 [Planctomycetaceae bacterium]|nr:hypothetical protein [Planctomycetaceae bacterium]